MAIIGEKLTSPESGWVRFDDTDSSILYTDFTLQAVPLAYDGTTHFNPVGRATGEVKFSFYGTSIRIISPNHPTVRSSSIDIYIDGNMETFRTNHANDYQILSFEKTGLANTFHDVVIKNFKVASASYAPFGLDAIDISDGGFIFEEGQLERYFIRQGDNLYYKDGSLWNSVSLNLANIADILSKGMSDIIENDISDFEATYGESWSPVRWTDGVAIPKLTMTALPNPQLIYPVSDILLTGVEAIDKLTITSLNSVKIVISFNSGATWKVFKNGLWDTVENAYDGMTNAELNALTSSQIELGREGSNFIRFSYSLANNAEVDNMEMKVTLQGYEKIANTSDFELDYDIGNKKITYNIKKSGTYSATYVDA